MGREWYVHTIYTVRSKENANRGIGKRSVEHQYHSLFSGGSPGASTQRRQKRGIEQAPELAKGIGAENSRGTNIQHIALDRNKKQAPQRGVTVNGVLPRELNNQSAGVSIVTIIGGAAAVLLAICLIAIIILLLKRKQNSDKRATKESGSNEPMMPPYNYTSDSSEV